MGNKLLVICGPTAVGKTNIGIFLARKFGGELISADSRQVYKGLDIITGKDIPEISKLKSQNSNLNINNDKFEVGYRIKDDVPVWLVDIVEPDYAFSAGEFALLAQKVIADIWSRGKLPIIVGGTGFYIRSVINPYDTYMIPPDKALRSRLEKTDLAGLQKKLAQDDATRWENMNDSDKKNPRRLIRAIEVEKWRQKFSQQNSGLQIIPAENIFFIGLRADFRLVLRDRIHKRIEKRIDQGAVEEVKKLMGKKYSWFLPAFTSTGASQLKKYIEGKDTLQDALKSWQFQEIDYSKRQLTWFKKDKKIRWFDITAYDNRGIIEETVAKWYTAH